jgi:hypothetical protein
MERARVLGKPAGGADHPLLAQLAFVRRLILGSGGLSHQPPVPELAKADAHLRHRLLGSGKQLPPDERELRQQRVISAARRFTELVVADRVQFAQPPLLQQAHKAVVPHRIKGMERARDAHLRHRLLGSGKQLPPDERELRQQRVISAARRFPAPAQAAGATARQSRGSAPAY